MYDFYWLCECLLSLVLQFTCSSLRSFLKMSVAYSYVQLELLLHTKVLESAIISYETVDPIFVSLRSSEYYLIAARKR
jgi:hypothetical protein